MKGKMKFSKVFLCAVSFLFGLLSLTLLIALTGPSIRSSHAAPLHRPISKPVADAPWGTNTQVNDDREGLVNQNGPALAASKTTSDVYAVWTDQRNGDGDIYAARSTDGGKTWGAAVRVNHDSPGAWQSNPDIAINAAGDLHVVWEDDRESTSADIYYAHSTDGGATWSQEIRINDVVTNSQSAPAIAVLTDTLCVAWGDGRTSSVNPDIYVDCSVDGGANWGIDTRVNDDGAGINAHYMPDIALGDAYRVHVVWHDNRDGAYDYNVYYAHSLAAGGWYTNTMLNSVTTNAQQNPAIVANGSNIHVIWEDYRGGSYAYIYGNESLDGGETWLRDRLVSGIDHAYESDIAMDGQGIPWATWRVITGGQYAIYGDFYGPNGWDTVNEVITQSTVFKQTPGIAGGDTWVYVAWDHSPAGEDSDILLSIRDTTTWGDAMQINDEGGARQERPGIAVGSTGDLYAAWKDYRDDPNSANLYAAHSTGEGDLAPWSSNIQVSDEGHAPNNAPALAATGSMTVHVVWDSLQYEEEAIYYDRSGDGGATWGTDHRLSDLRYNGPASPDIVMSGTQEIYVVWREQDGLYLDESSDGGTSWVSPTRIMTSTGTMFEPALARDLSGTLHVAWEERLYTQPNAYYIGYAHSTDGGTLWHNRQYVSGVPTDTSRSAPDIAVSPVSGYVYLVWEEGNAGSEAIYYAKSTDGGMTWEAPTTISAGGPAMAPAVAVDSEGIVYVIWQDASGADEEVTYIMSTDDGQTWSSPSRVNDDTTSWPQQHPAIAAGHSAYAVWADFRNVNWDIYAAALTCPIPLEDLSISGPTTTTTGAYVMFTAEISPSNATPPITYTWEPTPARGQGTAESTYMWPMSGTYVITATAQNCDHFITAAHTITVEASAVCTDVTGVDLSLLTSSTIYTDTAVQFSAAISPDVATKPYTYTIDYDDGERTTATSSTVPLLLHHTFVNTGTYAVKVAVWNCAMTEGEAVTDVMTVTVAPSPAPCVGLTGVSITGPSTTTTGIPVTLEAKVLPSNATPPINYEWMPLPGRGQATAKTTYYWRRPGSYVIRVEASNCDLREIYTDTHTVIVTAPPPRLPCIRGEVTYADTPLAGVTVELIPGTSTADPDQTTTTGADGSYSFCNVSPGTYYLKRYAPSAAYIGWVASRIYMGSSNLVKNLDLPKKMTLLSPEDGVTLYTTVPTLTWQALPEAGSYTLQLNKTDGWELVEQRTGLINPSYVVASALDRGTSYTWQIDAYTGTHWVGTTQTAFEFSVNPLIVIELPPIVSINTSLRIEDAPEGVVVNKLIGDSTGQTNVTYVDVMAHVWTWDADATSGVQVTLNVPGNQLGSPVNTWVRNTNGGTLTSVASTNLGGGRYQVTTNLPKGCPFIFCSYRKQVVWRFRIPHSLSPQTLNLQSSASLPGHLVFGSFSDADLRLLSTPSALIVTHRGLLYDNHSHYYTTRLLEQLFTVAQGYPHNDNPTGVIYYADRYDADVTNWDNTNVDYTSQASANTAADEVDDLIEDWVEDGSWTFSWHLPFSITVNLPMRPYYLMLVGDDDVIPFYRYNDPSNDEGINKISWCAHGWCLDSNTNPAVHATDEDFLFTDNPYGDLWGGTDWETGDLELAVGRLIGDSASDMLNLLNSSLATDGSTGRAVMASVDGWELGMSESPACPSNEIHDVLNVPGRLTARGFNVLNDSETPRTVDVLSPYPSNWNAGFRSAANGGMDIFFIGGHDGHDHAVIPGDDFSPDDTCASSATCDYHRFDNDHPLAFIVGCHGGLPVPDIDVAGGVDDDMVYDLAHEGARAYIGATGFSYGSPGSLCYATWGERLLQHFFDEFLPAGSQSWSIGGALREAKDTYVFGFGTNDGLDRKTMTEFNLYGVPWQRLDYPGSTSVRQSTGGSVIPSAASAAVRIHPSRIVQADGFRYTRTITVEVVTYTVGHVITDGVTYDLLSIPGGGVALAPDLPMLPYVEGYTLTLPISATVASATLVDVTCSDEDAYEIPIVVARPWSEGGTTYTTTTDIDTLYPSEAEQLRWQQRGDRMLFTLFPIRHNPTSNATRFCSELVFQVAYDAPLALAVSALQPEQETLMPGEPVTVTALLENVSDELLTITGTLTLLDIWGDPVGWQDMGPFSVVAGGQEPIEAGWHGVLEEGSYNVQVILWHEGQVAGMAASRIYVVGSAMTAFEVPTTTVTTGEEALFSVTFANRLSEPITATAYLMILDTEGNPVTHTLQSQPMQVAAGEEGTLSISWQAENIGTGTYTAQARVENQDGLSYGPLTKDFEVAGKVEESYMIYLPLVLKSS